MLLRSAPDAAPLHVAPQSPDCMVHPRSRRPGPRAILQGIGCLLAMGERRTADDSGRGVSRSSVPYAEGASGRQQLNNSSMLLTEAAGPGVEVEVDSIGQTAWEWDIPSYDGPSYDGKRPLCRKPFAATCRGARGRRGAVRRRLTRRLAATARTLDASRRGRLPRCEVVCELSPSIVLGGLDRLCMWAYETRGSGEAGTRPA